VQKGPTEEAEEQEEETAEGRSLRLLSGGVQTDAVYGALFALGAIRNFAPPPPFELFVAVFAWSN
jgi:hypothetical protein